MIYKDGFTTNGKRSPGYDLSFEVFLALRDTSDKLEEYEKRFDAINRSGYRDYGDLRKSFEMRGKDLKEIKTKIKLAQWSFSEYQSPDLF